MKKMVFFLLSLMLMSCGIIASMADVAGVAISPGEHQWIEQGEKQMFTAEWWSSVGIEKIEWLLDGVVVAEKPLHGNTTGTSHFMFYAADYEVKTFTSGEVASYEFGCRLYSADGPLGGIGVGGWDEVVVYVCPPSSEATDGGAPATPLDIPPTITSISWHKVVDYIGHEYLGIELAWTPVEGVIGYEIFARTGLAGEFTQTTEGIDSYVLAGFHLPTEETTYFFKVRAVMEFYIAETGEYDYLTGPFSQEASIDVPALAQPEDGPASPPITAPIEIHTPTPFPLLPIGTKPILRLTSVPTRRIVTTRRPILVTTRRPILVPTPTPAPTQVIRRIETRIFTAVPAPVQTAPALKLIPFKRP